MLNGFFELTDFRAQPILVRATEFNVDDDTAVNMPYNNNNNKILIP